MNKEECRQSSLELLEGLHNALEAYTKLVTTGVVRNNDDTLDILKVYSDMANTYAILSLSGGDGTE